MEHLSLNRLLMHQTLIVHELGLYLNDKEYIPHPREMLLLDGVRSRCDETRQQCDDLRHEFRKRLAGK